MSSSTDKVFISLRYRLVRSLLNNCAFCSIRNFSAFGFSIRSVVNLEHALISNVTSDELIVSGAGHCPTGKLIHSGTQGIRSYIMICIGRVWPFSEHFLYMSYSYESERE